MEGAEISQWQQRGIPWTFLYHLPELVQRAQPIWPWLVSESLRPAGPRHLADIEVAVAVHRKPCGAKNSVGPRPGPSPPSREIRFPVLSTMVTRGPRLGTLRLTGCTAPSSPM